MFTKNPTCSRLSDYLLFNGGVNRPSDGFTNDRNLTFWKEVYIRGVPSFSVHDTVRSSTPLTKRTSKFVCSGVKRRSFNSESHQFILLLLVSTLLTCLVFTKSGFRCYKGCSGMTPKRKYPSTPAFPTTTFVPIPGSELPTWRSGSPSNS